MNATTETQSDIHCLCTVCSGKIAFPPEMLEQTIQCPHCKMDTRLYRAPDAPKPPSPSPKPIPKAPEPLPPESEKPIEDSLNQIGLVYLIGGCVAAGVIILYGFIHGAAQRIVGQTETDADVSRVANHRAVAGFHVS